MLEGLLDRKCAREDDFAEIFEALGDREAQQRIRDENPEGRHCRLVAANPEACLSCSAPENPYRAAKAEAVRLAYANRALVAAALDLYHGHLIGMPDTELSPQEAVMLRLAIEAHELEKLRAQGDLIGAHVGNKLAEIMAAVFGKK